MTHPPPPMDDPEMSPRPCPACGALAAEELLATRATSEADGTAFRVVRCTACGLQLTRPLPTESEVAELYGHEYYGEGRPGLLSWERLRLLFHEVVLRHRARALAGRPPGRALDVGCGDGDMLAFLWARGWEVRGQDVSPAAAARAAAKGIEVHQGPLSGAPYEAGSFDVVMLWHVLEHLTEPLEELRRIRGLLAPEGLLVVEVPNNASWTRRLCGESGLHPPALDAIPSVRLHSLGDELLRPLPAPRPPPGDPLLHGRLPPRRPPGQGPLPPPRLPPPLAFGALLLAGGAGGAPRRGGARGRREDQGFGPGCGQPKVWIYNYRIDALRSLLAPRLERSYVRVHPNVFLAGAAVTPGEEVRFLNPWEGRYRLYGADGRPRDSVLVVGGTELRGPLSLGLGEHRLTVPTGSGDERLFLLPEDVDLPGHLPVEDPPLMLFGGVYD